MKKLLMLFMAMGFASSARAYTLTYEKSYSSFTVTGITCQTATATQIHLDTTAFSGMQLAGYRVTNLDGTYAAYFGPNSNVSATESDAAVGERLSAGQNGVWNIGRIDSPLNTVVNLWCKAASGAGSAGVRVARAAFFFK